MQLHQDLAQGYYTIRSYGPGRVTLLAPRSTEPRVTEARAMTPAEVLTRSAVVMPQQVVRDWPPQCLDEATSAHFEAVAALAPEVVLLGSGRRLRFPPADILSPLRARGIGVEVMDTGAACRTYNILVAEGRLVAAVLTMIEEA